MFLQVKRILIRLTVKPGSRVLDLACGHCQDLLKFGEARVARLLGIDFSRESILEARKRVRESSRNWTLQRMLRVPEFHVGNVLQSKVWTQLKGELFDVVSVQLAIHYMVQTETQLRDFLKRSVFHLEKGGVFIGSTMCCRALVEVALQMRLLLPPEADEPDEEFAQVKAARVEEANGGDVYFYGNSVFAIFFSGDTLRELLSPWGIPKRPGEQVLKGDEDVHVCVESNILKEFYFFLFLLLRKTPPDTSASAVRPGGVRSVSRGSPPFGVFFGKVRNLLSLLAAGNDRREGVRVSLRGHEETGGSLGSSVLDELLFSSASPGSLGRLFCVGTRSAQVAKFTPK